MDLSIGPNFMKYMTYYLNELEVLPYIVHVPPSYYVDTTH